MSPASKSKSKDKTAKAVKEQSKAALKSSAAANSGNSIPGSAYNPTSGTFHTLEIAPPDSLQTPQNNGRFRTIDETEEHSGSSLGTSPEYDSLSNNDSCSDESEYQKEKTSSTPRTEAIPGSDTDKRDKIRQKNERKHQRQKERRTQELHERCSGYLMSRKLETLSQKLVSMGFSPEQSTMALILNEGRVEESVAWLFEGVEENEKRSAVNLDEVNLKLDISDELSQITALKIKYKCTEQEVERAVVACEGDLEKADHSLKAQKQEPAYVAQVLDQSGSIASSSELNKKLSSVENSVLRMQMKVVVPVTTQQQRRDDREFGKTKAVAAGNAQIDANRNLQSLKKLQQKDDWIRSQVTPPLDKRWPGASSSPSVSYSLSSPLPVAVPQAKLEARYAIGGHEALTNMHIGTLKEPIIMMQRPQSTTGKQNIQSTSIGFSASPPASTGWYPHGTTSIEMMKIVAANGGLGHQLRNFSLNGSTQRFYPQSHCQPFVSSPMEPSIPGWSGPPNAVGTLTRSSPLAMPSSLGLFTGWGSLGSSGSSSPVDWSTGGSMPQCDLSSIDWSLDSASLAPPVLKSNQLYDMRSPAYMGAKASRPAANGDVCFAGFRDGLLTDKTSVRSHEWTSPFNGEDLFRASRQFVTSPISVGNENNPEWMIRNGQLV